MAGITIIVTFCIICFFKAGMGEIQSVRPDYKYSKEAGGYLKLHLVPATWSEARLWCYYEGGVLASPVNQSLAQAMMSLLYYHDSPPSKIFTGFHTQFSNGDFVSVEGVPLYAVNLNWVYREPETTAKDCIVMYKKGSIADVMCSSAYPYMCYKVEPEHRKLTVCGTTDKEYKYDLRTGSCYKVHRVGRTWSRGFMTCQAEGGHMAIINSETEAQVLKELLSKIPEDKIFADYKHVASIGFQDWGERGSWWTIHGQELSEAGYAVWEKGSPDGKDSQFCGGMNRSGRLNDIWCKNKTFAVICEIPLTDVLDDRYELIDSQE